MTELIHKATAIYRPLVYMSGSTVLVKDAASASASMYCTHACHDNVIYFNRELLVLWREGWVLRQDIRLG